MLGRMPTFLTTHTGSLPRTTDLTRLLHGREDRQPTPSIEQRISDGVKQAVRGVPPSVRAVKTAW
jgi:methionine synthase II (cobalamin-independent)